MSEERLLPNQGLVQVYTGEGKGKTTAALGAVLRAAGAGLRVYVAFFMKGDFDYGEKRGLAKLANVTTASFGGPGFVDPADIRPEAIEQAGRGLAAARAAVLSGNYDLVVLDEVNVATAWGLVALDDVVQLVRDRPRNVELILTGRYADPAVIELADLVTEMTKVKHPFDEGIAGRRGIEY